MIIKEAIFDSGIFIGSKYSRDQYNEGAIRILENLKEGNIGKVYITNYVLAECVNFLLIKAGFQIANDALDYLTKTDSIEVVEIEDLDRIKGMLKKYKNLSITDCSLLVLSEKLKIKEIFSFDKHFDSIKEIKKINCNIKWLK